MTELELESRRQNIARHNRRRVARATVKHEAMFRYASSKPEPSLKQVAARFRMSYKRTSMILRAMGFPPRKRGRPAGYKPGERQMAALQEHWGKHPPVRTYDFTREDRVKGGRAWGEKRRRKAERRIGPKPLLYRCVCGSLSPDPRAAETCVHRTAA